MCSTGSFLVCEVSYWSCSRGFAILMVGAWCACMGKSTRVNKFVTNWDLRVIMLHSIRSCRLLVYLCGILVRSIGLDFAV